MTVNATPCFCCSKISFSECCEPLLQDHFKALTPQALMRSRYTAYVLENEEYLLATWEPSKRPTSLSLKENKVKWLELVIHSENVEQTAKSTGEVDFSASFIEGDQLCVLRETSSFVQKGGLWYYVEGSPDITRKKLGRNGLCPCNSGKKFKRCCLGPIED